MRSQQWPPAYSDENSQHAHGHGLQSANSDNSDGTFDIASDGVQPYGDEPPEREREWERET